MEKRITTLEVLMDQTACSIDRLDRSIRELRSEMDQNFVHLETKIDQKFVRLEASIASHRKNCDKKFVWLIGIHTTIMIAILFCHRW